jgi:hypothetical protein
LDKHLSLTTCLFQVETHDTEARLALDHEAHHVLAIGLLIDPTLDPTTTKRGSRRDGHLALLLR